MRIVEHAVVENLPLHILVDLRPVRSASCRRMSDASQARALASAALDAQRWGRGWPLSRSMARNTAACTTTARLGGWRGLRGAPVTPAQ